mmetsp:Transcript_17811/g.27706  ORF Transcript_17811/g.27706 Transcript_17811/m.27706 type:complete len:375 (+) Transcript_17811:124-1248(+)|eukprot:CAMPEP_0196828562 /NCGR_PEP_ID=MMETSP1362-20130617/94741_1 /TAXON_ID=163516 /ORGANISM="Leptocylindrus danicus, Strain CCMP1856" /LENGTH=374 /DNA_ID=CAMNT_0042209245 /DNA_START=1609 /DNA_END=2733 /DNA_ORIENTATION=+
MALKGLKKSGGVPILREGQRRAALRVKSRIKKQHGKKGKKKLVPIQHPEPWNDDFALSSQPPSKNHYVGYDGRGRPQPKKVYVEELGERAKQIERLRTQAENRRKVAQAEAKQRLMARKEARRRRKEVDENTSISQKPLPQAISPQQTPKRITRRRYTERCDGSPREEFERNELKVSYTINNAGGHINETCKSIATSPFDQSKIREALAHFNSKQRKTTLSGDKVSNVPCVLKDLEEKFERLQLDEEEIMKSIEIKGNGNLAMEATDAKRHMVRDAHIINQSTTAPGEFLWHPECDVAPVRDDDDFRQQILLARESRCLRNKSMCANFANKDAISISEIIERVTENILQEATKSVMEEVEDAIQGLAEEVFYNL